MIKNLTKYDVKTTPFIASKNWHFLNSQNDDLVLLDVNSESPAGEDTFVAVEFIDYNNDYLNGILNTSCNIALDQQTDDPVLYEEGISGSGLFYVDDVKNLNGTYKRLVYHQIIRAFYNNYHNPLQIFGLETIDFQTSGLKRYPASTFKVFSLPQIKFGEKMVEGSVTFVDNAFDDNYVINDDGQGNLIAAENLFSKIQEVRHIDNVIDSGSISYSCSPPST